MEKILSYLAKVEELLPGTDGKVYSAVVKVSSSDRRPLYLLRKVVQHLIPVEVNAAEEEHEGESTQHPTLHSSSPVVPDQNQRPRRNAAVIGEIVQMEIDY